MSEQLDCVVKLRDFIDSVVALADDRVDLIERWIFHRPQRRGFDGNGNPRHRLASALAHSRRALRVLCAQDRQPPAEAPRIELRDRKRTTAALCASLATKQPVAALARCVGQRGIDNLDQLLVSPGEPRSIHTSSIAAGLRTWFVV